MSDERENYDDVNDEDLDDYGDVVDDEEEAEGEENEEEEGEETKGGRENDFEEDVEEDIEEDAGPARKKKKSTDKSQFFEEEAEESDDGGGGREERYDEEEEAEEDYDYGDEFISKENIEDDPTVHHRFREEEHKKDVAEVERLKLRQEEMKQRSNRPAEEKRIPSIEDPKLFLIPCKPGKEMTAIMKIMKRFQVRERGPPKDRLKVLSVFTTPGSKGHIYVEAWKEDHVRHALYKIEYLALYKVSLVPLNEMVQAVSIKDTVHKLRPKQWVRMKQGVYKGDLAQIVTVEDQNTRALVKVIPRIDYSAAATGQKRRRPGARPQAVLFNKAEVEKLDPDAPVDRAPEGTGFVSRWRGKKFNDSGFLLKLVKVRNLQIDAVNPQLEEIERFKSKDDEADLEGEGTGYSLIEKKTIYKKGDRIRVINGALTNLTGRVITVSAGQIVVMPDHPDLHEPIDFHVEEVVKYFEVGEHVKMIAGKHKGETGLVVSVEEKENIVTVFSDVSSVTIKAFASDLIEWSEVSAGKDTLGTYRLHDMVMMGPGNFVVIIKVENNGFKVIDTNGNVSSARIQDVGRKRGSRFSAAYDNAQNQIGWNDTVKVIQGPEAGNKGQIKHIYRSKLFLYSRRKNNTGGIFVVNARDCILPGQKLQQQYGGGGSFERPTARAQNQPRKLHFRHKRRHANMRNPLYLKKVIITRGRWKSHKGIVKDILEKEYRVQLEAKAKVVTVKKMHVREPHDIQDTYDDRNYMGGQTPMLGSKTPMLEESGRTPMHGSRTPLHDGSMTPHNPSTPGGSINPFAASAFATPHHDDSVEYTQTPAPEDVATPRTPLTAPNTMATTPRTPQTYNPISPFPAQDGGDGVAQVMTPNSPHTPAIPNTPYQVATPTMEVEETKLQLDIGVMYDGKEAVVRSIDGNDIGIDMVKGGIKNIVNEMDLTIIRPSSKDDRVKMIGGPYVGAVGTLVSLDSENVVVKLDSGEVQVAQVQHVARYMAS